MEQNINQLAESAKNNEKAFIELYTLTYPLIYRYCYTKIGNQHLSEDIVSTVFEIVLSNLKQFDSKLSSFKTWLFSIVNHKIIDYWRKANRDIRSLDDAHELNALPAGTSDDNDKALLLKQIHLALNGLPETEAEVIRLKYYGGLSNEEISKLLSISEKSVPSVATRGLKKLAKLIN